MKRMYLREIDHSRIFSNKRARVGSASLNVRWNCQASINLDSASAMVYMSRSTGSTRRGFAVRTYLTIRGAGLGVKEMACIIFDA